MARAFCNAGKGVRKTRMLNALIGSLTGCLECLIQVVILTIVASRTPITLS
jgi:hypothetical protein